MGRSEERLAAGARTLVDAGIPGAHVRTFAGDVLDETAIASACEAAEAGTSGLAIALANAGTGGFSPLTATTTAEWDRVIETNLRGTFLIFREAARRMRAHGSGGSLCAISSIAGLRSHRWMGSYCVSKAGIDALVRNCADELGRFGIRVNSVAPGLVDTEIAAGLFADDTVHADYQSCMPLVRTGTTDDIAAAVDFLCSPQADWVTGVTLPVDGGHHLRRGPDLDSFATAMFPDEIA